MKLYLRYLSTYFKGVMQYKTSFLLTLLGQFLSSFNLVLGIYFMMHRFGQVDGFTYHEVLLCYSLISLSYNLSECFFRAFDVFPSMLGNGEFDRILLRPRGIVFQVVATKMDFTRAGRLVQAFVLLAYALYEMPLTFTPWKVFTMVTMLLAGMAIFTGLFLFASGLSFFTLEGLEIINIFTYGAADFGKYPVSIYGKNILKIATFLIPYALFQYYPFLYLIEKESAHWYGILPLCSLWFLIPCILTWNFGLKHYKSTGS